MNQESQIILYQTEDGKTRLEVRFENENVWLSQKLMAELFETSVPNINMHIKNIFDSGELNPNSVIKEFLITASDGKNYKTKMHSLDVIIAVGYRVNSIRGVLFRQWATDRLKEYVVKGFTMDDVRLKQGGHKSRYFEELLDRIRDIRSSERTLYQKVTDIYATSIDYRKDAKETDIFFKTVQNKMHYAVTGRTAAELINERVGRDKKQIGLTNFFGFSVIKRDIYIAKNYLQKEELKMLNLVVDAYLSFAEIQAKSEVSMSMKNWIGKLDEFLTLLGKGVLHDSGGVSMEEAQIKAEQEYEAYREDQQKNFLSDFDREMKKIEDVDKD